MAHSSLTERVLVLSSGDGGLGGCELCERGTVPPSSSTSVLPPPHNVP